MSLDTQIETIIQEAIERAVGPAVERAVDLALTKALAERVRPSRSVGDNVVTAEEAAEILGVTANTVRSLVRVGKLRNLGPSLMTTRVRLSLAQILALFDDIQADRSDGGTGLLEPATRVVPGLLSGEPSRTIASAPPARRRRSA
jgi:hypothetical protein